MNQRGDPRPSVSRNASPADDFSVAGPIEQALVGMPVANTSQPIELLRLVHSFDPCLSCSVHLVRPNGQSQRFIVHDFTTA